MTTGKQVWAVVLGSKGTYNQGVTELYDGNWTVKGILKLMRGQDTKFYIRKPENMIKKEEIFNDQ